MKKLGILFLSFCIVLSAVVCMPMSAGAYEPTKTEEMKDFEDDKGVDGLANAVDPMNESNKVGTITDGSYFGSSAGWSRFFTANFDFYAATDDTSKIQFRLKLGSKTEGVSAIWGNGYTLSKGEIASKKWYTFNIAADITENKMVLSYKEKDKDEDYKVIRTEKITTAAGEPDNRAFDVIGFMTNSGTDEFYIDNISRYRYNDVTTALKNASDAATVKDAMDFFNGIGFITLNSTLSEDVANKVYTSLAGKTFATSEEVQAAYDAAAAKYGSPYYVEFKDASAQKGANTFTVNFTNNTYNSANAVLINAVYGADKTLLSVSYSDSVSVASGAEQPLTVSANVDADAESVKQIVINSFNELTPYSAANSLTVE